MRRTVRIQGHTISHVLHFLFSKKKTMDVFWFLHRIQNFGNVNNEDINKYFFFPNKVQIFVGTLVALMILNYFIGILPFDQPVECI